MLLHFNLINCFMIVMMFIGQIHLGEIYHERLSGNIDAFFDPSIDDLQDNFYDIPYLPKEASPINEAPQNSEEYASVLNEDDVFKFGRDKLYPQREDNKVDDRIIDQIQHLDLDLAELHELYQLKNQAQTKFTVRRSATNHRNIPKAKRKSAEKRHMTNSPSVTELYFSTYVKPCMKNKMNVHSGTTDTLLDTIVNEYNFIGKEKHRLHLKMQTIEEDEKKLESHKIKQVHHRKRFVGDQSSRRLAKKKTQPKCVVDKSKPEEKPIFNMTTKVRIKRNIYEELPVHFRSRKRRHKYVNSVHFSHKYRHANKSKNNRIDLPDVCKKRMCGSNASHPMHPHKQRVTEVSFNGGVNSKEGIYSEMADNEDCATEVDDETGCNTTQESPSTESTTKETNKAKKIKSEIAPKHKEKNKNAIVVIQEKSPTKPTIKSVLCHHCTKQPKITTEKHDKDKAENEFEEDHEDYKAGDDDKKEHKHKEQKPNEENDVEFRYKRNKLNDHTCTGKGHTLEEDKNAIDDYLKSETTVDSRETHKYYYRPIAGVNKHKEDQIDEYLKEETTKTDYQKNLGIAQSTKVENRRSQNNDDTISNTSECEEINTTKGVKNMDDKNAVDKINQFIKDEVTVSSNLKNNENYNSVQKHKENINNSFMLRNSNEKPHKLEKHSDFFAEHLKNPKLLQESNPICNQHLKRKTFYTPIFQKDKFQRKLKQFKEHFQKQQNTENDELFQDFAPTNEESVSLRQSEGPTSPPPVKLKQEIFVAEPKKLDKTTWSHNFKQFDQPFVKDKNEIEYLDQEDDDYEEEMPPAVSKSHKKMKQKVYIAHPKKIDENHKVKILQQTFEAYNKFKPSDSRRQKLNFHLNDDKKNRIEEDEDEDEYNLKFNPRLSERINYKQQQHFGQNKFKDTTAKEDNEEDEHIIVNINEDNNNNNKKKKLRLLELKNHNFNGELKYKKIPKHFNHIENYKDVSTEDDGLAFIDTDFEKNKPKSENIISSKNEEKQLNSKTEKNFENNIDSNKKKIEKIPELSLVKEDHEEEIKPKIYVAHLKNEGRQHHRIYFEQEKDPKKSSKHKVTGVHTSSYKHKRIAEDPIIPIKKIQTIKKYSSETPHEDFIDDDFYTEAQISTKSRKTIYNNFLKHFTNNITKFETELSGTEVDHLNDETTRTTIISKKLKHTTEIIEENNSGTDEQLYNEIPVNKHQIQLSTNCDSQDYNSKDHCICSVQTMLRDLIDDVKDINSSLNYEYDCSKYIGIQPGIVISNNSNSLATVWLEKRDNFLLRKGSRIGRDVESLLNENLNVVDSANFIYATVGSKVVIPCGNKSKDDSEDDKIIWTINNGAPETAGIKENNGRQLLIERVSPQDTNNYTCSISHKITGEKYGPEKKFVHKLSIVELPIYSLMITVILNETDKCRASDLETLNHNYPVMLNKLLCQGNDQVCSVSVDKPQCTRLHSENTITIHATLKTLPLFTMLPKLREKNCGINCLSRIYSIIVKVLQKNFASVTNLPVFFRDNDKHTQFNPIQYEQGDKTNTFSNSILTICPQGFGIFAHNEKLCFACEPHSFNPGNKKNCITCPSGSYQPMYGSGSCLPCSSPLDDARCLFGSKTEIVPKLYFIIPIILILVIVIVIIYCIFATMQKSSKMGVKTSDLFRGKPFDQTENVQMTVIEQVFTGEPSEKSYAARKGSRTKLKSKSERRRSSQQRKPEPPPVDF